MRRGERFLLALSICALVLPACTPPGADEEVSFRLPVTVREVGTGTVEDRVVATGTIRAPEAITLRAETPGVFMCARHPSGRRLAEGDRVEAGQKIGEVTGEDVRIAARTEANRQRFESARRDYESKQRLYDDGLISEVELRAAEDAMAEARVGLDRSLLTETRSVLTTPIAGVVLRLARDEQGLPLADGQLVVQGAMLAQVATTEQLVVDVDLVGPDVARVAPGMRARVRHHAWSDRTFEGRIARLAPSIDPQTRTLRAEVEIRNTGGLLLPGMFVEVTLITDRREEVTVIPREAVTERGGTKVAFVLAGQRVKERQLALGYGDDEIVEVRQGVEPGERVVVKGLETLSDESRVRVVTGG